MTIIRKISLFEIQQLLEMESSHLFDAIFATFDMKPIFHLFSKKVLRGALRECNYSVMIRIVERIPTVKDLRKRLANGLLFRPSRGFLFTHGQRD